MVADGVWNLESFKGSPSLLFSMFFTWIFFLFAIYFLPIGGDTCTVPFQLFLDRD